MSSIQTAANRQRQANCFQHIFCQPVFFLPQMKRQTLVFGLVIDDARSRVVGLLLMYF